jgi:heme oxygenase (mycobilin-producing)
VFASAGVRMPSRPVGQNSNMTIVKINAITVPADSGDELARRFAARAGAVDDQDGFEGFELLRPNDERTTWLVITRWRDEEAFQTWVSSPAFAGPAIAVPADPHGHPLWSSRHGHPIMSPIVRAGLSAHRSGWARSTSART